MCLKEKRDKVKKIENIRTYDSVDNDDSHRRGDSVSNSDNIIHHLLDSCCFFLGIQLEFERYIYQLLSDVLS